MYEYTIYTYDTSEKKIVLGFVSGDTGMETAGEIHQLALDRLEEIRAQHGDKNILMSRRCRVGI